MYFDSLDEALWMAGHGPYVWAAYAVTLSAIAVLLVLPRLRQRKIMRQLAAQLRRQQADSAVLSPG